MTLTVDVVVDGYSVLVLSFARDGPGPVKVQSDAEAEFDAGAAVEV